MEQKIIDIYKKLYGLPELRYKEEVDFNFFRLCQKKYNFVTISIFNERREVLLIRDLNKNIGWELVGGTVGKKEKLEDSVNRIVLNKAGISIDELQPIAVLTNIFQWKNKKTFHRGIAFTALARGRIKNQPPNIRTIYQKTALKKMAFQNKKIFHLANKAMGEKLFDPPYEEIETARKHRLGYFLNKLLVKRLGNISSNKIKNQIFNLISGKPETIIDASCGDDDLIFEIEKRLSPRLCVGNDISWKVLSFLRSKQKTNNIILTNHDVRNLPFNKKFDLVILKNTLHHIPDKDQEELLKKLLNISKQLIIVDVDDPAQSSTLSKIWHWYYVHCLGDKGESFLTFRDFKEKIKFCKPKDKKARFGIINTIKGVYFYCSIEREKNSKEVEIKAKIPASKIKTVKRRIIQLKPLSQGKTKEADIYFTAPHRNFIKSKECLRIRERGEYRELTYKGPSNSSMKRKKQFWKEEFNIPLPCPVEEMRKFLQSLGFKEVAKVFKERETFLLGESIITFDKVKGLGWFLEIEKSASTKKEEKESLRENLRLLEQLGLNENNIVSEPYRDLVIKNNN